MRESFQYRMEQLIFQSIKLSGISLLILSTIGIFIGGVWAFTGFFIVFVYYFIAELLLELVGVGATITPENEFEFIHPDRPSWIDRYGIVFYSVSQLLCLPVCMYLLTFKTHSKVDLIGGVLSLTFSCGSIGGIAGHDLIHRKNPILKWIGFLTLTTMNYGHFAISHLYGHHRSVGLENDWSTARYRESVFHFLYRAIVHGYEGAWVLENRRLTNAGRSWLSFENQMIQISIAQVLMTSLIFIVGGAKMFAIHLVFSFIALSFLEIVNYVSHYGLTRQFRPDGTLEKTMNIHSWESNNKVSNWFIFNTGKHCHHHRKPNALNYELMLAHENSMIPYGLQAMTLLSFIPPWYFSVMDRLLENRPTIVRLTKNS